MEIADLYQQIGRLQGDVQGLKESDDKMQVKLDSIGENVLGVTVQLSSMRTRVAIMSSAIAAVLTVSVDFLTRYFFKRT